MEKYVCCATGYEMNVSTVTQDTCYSETGWRKAFLKYTGADAADS